MVQGDSFPGHDELGGERAEGAVGRPDKRNDGRATNTG